MFSVLFCVTGLSQDLEELMVEGLLLQVSLPEVQCLYHVLLDRASSQETDRCMSPTEDESTDCDKHMQFNSQGNNLQLNQVQNLSNKQTDSNASQNCINISFNLCCILFSGWCQWCEGNCDWLRKENEASHGEGRFRSRAQSEGQKALPQKTEDE